MTLKLIGYYSVGILILWNLPLLKHLLWPFKIFTVALHEFGHALMGIFTGAKIKSITLDPNEGGATKMSGGNPYFTLPAGYIGSNIFGALMIFAGFDNFSSKVVAGIVGVSLITILVFSRNWLAAITTLTFASLIGFLWWFQESFYLRFFILFLGVMSGLYSIWDIVDDLIARKVNESDASKYSKLCCRGCLPPQVWGIIWFLISLVFLAVSIFAALIFFKE